MEMVLLFASLISSQVCSLFFLPHRRIVSEYEKTIAQMIGECHTQSCNTHPVLQHPQSCNTHPLLCYSTAVMDAADMTCASVPNTLDPTLCPSPNTLVPDPDLTLCPSPNCL